MKTEKIVNQKPKHQPQEINKSASIASDDRYPEHIPESQGDLADRATIEIDQEIQEGILRARLKAETSNR